MSIGGFLLGIINAAVIGVLLILAGLIILWVLSWFNLSIPEQIQRMYVILVALYVLYLIVGSLFGLGAPHLLPFRSDLGVPIGLAYA